MAIALWDLSIGGIDFNVFGIRVSSWEAYKPFRIGMVAMIGACWLNDRAAAPDSDELADAPPGGRHGSPSPPHCFGGDGGLLRYFAAGGADS